MQQGRCGPALQHPRCSPPLTSVLQRPQHGSGRVWPGSSLCPGKAGGIQRMPSSSQWFFFVCVRLEEGSLQTWLLAPAGAVPPPPAAAPFSFSFPSLPSQSMVPRANPGPKPSFSPQSAIYLCTLSHICCPSWTDGRFMVSTLGFCRAVPVAVLRFLRLRWALWIWGRSLPYAGGSGCPSLAQLGFRGWRRSWRLRPAAGHLLMLQCPRAVPMGVPPSLPLCMERGSQLGLWFWQGHALTPWGVRKNKSL